MQWDNFTLFKKSLLQTTYCFPMGGNVDKKEETNECDLKLIVSPGN